MSTPRAQAKPLGIFDDALPACLVASDAPSVARHLPIRKVERSQVSPYVIRLERQHVQHATPERALDVEALKDALMVDAEEDDALPEALVNDVVASAAEIQSQLRETGRHLVTAPTIAGDARPLVSHASVAHVMPVPIPLSPVNLHELVIPFDDDENEALEAEHEDDATLPIAEVRGETAVFAQEALTEPVAEVPVVEVRAARMRFTVLPQGWQRALAGFMALSFALVLPLHAMQGLGAAVGGTEDISAVGRAAMDDLSRGASAFADARYAVAEDEFSRAAAKFADAEHELSTMHAAIAAVVNVLPQTDRTYDSVTGLIAAGRELSTVASTMSQAAESIAPSTAIDVVTKLELLALAVERAAPHAVLAAESLEKVDPAVIPADYVERVAQLQAYAPRLSAALEEFASFSQALATMLGGDGAMRYLVAFQNPTELRPTGGFIGSFAEVDVRHGAIASMRIPGGGTYDVQGQLTQFVAAPSPLGLINARWELQDANWFPDFPSSAKKIQWFYENAGGPSTDGVLAVNATFVVALLEILGPVEMPEYGRTINAENFMFETQKIVELEYDKEENAPKAFIGDLAPLLLERITQADMATFLAVLDLVGRSLEEKDIQVFFDDDGLEAAVNELGWSGAMKQTRGDYLMVVNTNLGGGKTDGVIEQRVDLDVTVAEDGSVVNTVTVAKTHLGMANALFSGRNNVDYLRLYVPEGSELLAADGFEIPSEDLFEDAAVPLATDEDLSLMMASVRKDAVTSTDIWEENGKTVFGNWMQTAPGETEVVSVTYRLPQTLFATKTNGLFAAAREELDLGDIAPYTLFVQKQPGADTRTVSVRVSLPDGVASVWSSHENLGSGTVEVTNARDAFFRLLLERE